SPLRASAGIGFSSFQKRISTDLFERTFDALHGLGSARLSAARLNARGRSGPSNFTQPVGGRLWCMKAGGPEEAFLRDFALVGACRKIGVRLTGGGSFNP